MNLTNTLALSERKGTYTLSKKKKNLPPPYHPTPLRDNKTQSWNIHSPSKYTKYSNEFHSSTSPRQKNCLHLDNCTNAHSALFSAAGVWEICHSQHWTLPDPVCSNTAIQTPAHPRPKTWQSTAQEFQR